MNKVQEAIGKENQFILLSDLSKKLQFASAVAKQILIIAPFTTWGAYQLLKRTPNFYFRLMSSWMCNYDKQYYADPEGQLNLRSSTLENLKNGVRRSLVDWHIYISDWGFEIKDIKKEIHLWHREEDTQVPVAMAKYVAKELSNCKSKFYRTAGHSLLWKHSEEILMTLDQLKT